MVALGVGGCAKKDDLLDQDWTKENKASQESWREVESLFTSGDAPAATKSNTLRGVRHDLVMAPQAAPNARCTCLDVVVGDAADPRVRWTGTPPALDANQAAFAMRTEGTNCPSDPTLPRRPSIYAVDEVNGNVLVVVEELPADRPQALGAVIPLPPNGGSIYVRARSDKGHVAMYAQGPKGPASMCRAYTRTASTLGN